MSEQTLVQQLRGPIGPLVLQHGHGINLTRTAAAHIEALEQELKAAKIATGEWIEKWEAAGHEINALEAVVEKLPRIDSGETSVKLGMTVYRADSYAIGLGEILYRVSEQTLFVGGDLMPWCPDYCFSTLDRAVVEHRIAAEAAKGAGT